MALNVSLKFWNTQGTIHRPHETQEEGKLKCVYFSPSYKAEQNTNRKKYRDNVWSKD